MVQKRLYHFGHTGMPLGDRKLHPMAHAPCEDLYLSTDALSKQFGVSNARPTKTAKELFGSYTWGNFEKHGLTGLRIGGFCDEWEKANSPDQTAVLLFLYG